MPAKKPLNKIKSSPLSRGLAMAKVSLNLGAKTLSHTARGLFSNPQEKADSWKEMILAQVEVLAQELGELKGSLMKVGQTLSVYGEHFLPPEANLILKSLQSQSPSLDWLAIEKALKKQLGPETLALLEVEHTPLAAASLGQVHRARRLSDGQEFALKVQYPGVDRAIDSDISALRRLLTVSKFLPKGPQFDEVFKEVKQMLEQEVDYEKEREATDFFRDALASDGRYVVPQTFPEFSTKRVIATSLEEGVAIDSAEVLSLSQERRNALGMAALDLYFKELYEFGRVQTDPHFGNYRVKIDPTGQSRDRLVLLDFGAVRKVPAKFLDPYRRMVRGSMNQDEEEVVAAARKLGLLAEGDAPELERQFIDLCGMIIEPFLGEETYDWGASDLPKRVAKAATKVIVSFRLRVPPRELVFLDRKLGGMFIFLHVLKTRFRGREILQPYVK